MHIDGIDVVVIESGEALIGSTEGDVERAVDEWRGSLLDPSYVDRFESWIRKEQPRHTVRLERFAIGRFPITNAQYRSYMQATGAPPAASIDAGEPDDHPVWDPRFEMTDGFIDWLRTSSGQRWRLPTEAEWEHAARGGTAIEYPWGDGFDPTMCNTIEAGIGRTTPVDSYVDAASPLGVVDLAGNVEEWTSSWYAPYPGGEAIDDDLTESLGAYRVLRGGSFNRGGDLARCARRHGPYPSDDYVFIGFRVALSLGPGPKSGS